MNQKKFAIGCNLVAAICFAISSCGHFYSGNIPFGFAFASIAFSQLVLAWINYRNL